jgi:serine/threonine protein kinase
MPAVGNSVYPQPGDYAEALQHPNKCFRDPELLKCLPERLNGSYLRTWTGGNAVVFKLDRAGKSFAVKAFKHRDDQREQRYQFISDYLRRLKSRHLIDFQYEFEGFRVTGKWYPLLRMDWVPGQTLYDWVKDRIQQRDSRAVEQMAKRWVELMGELYTNRIAHGDLQHGNILVRNNELVLVDYDGMWVPARGVAHTASAEAGLPGLPASSACGAATWA